MRGEGGAGETGEHFRTWVPWALVGAGKGGADQVWRCSWGACKGRGGRRGAKGGRDVVVGGRRQEGVGRVEGADGEGGLDEGAPLSKLSFPQGIWVAWMSRGEKGGESI